MGFLTKGRRKSQEAGNQILDVTASMKGSVLFEEAVHLRISGQFEGKLETKGDLTIGEQAVVRADVTGEIITIAGQVAGKIVAKNSLTLVSPAVVKAEVWTPSLRVEPGARLDGTIHMAADEAADRMSLEAVAEYLEMEIHLVEQWVRDGKIPAVQEGRQWRFEKARIDEWVALQKSS